MAQKEIRTLNKTGDLVLQNKADKLMSEIAKLRSENILKKERDSQENALWNKKQKKNELANSLRKNFVKRSEDVLGINAEQIANFNKEQIKILEEKIAAGCKKFFIFRNALAGIIAAMPAPLWIGLKIIAAGGTIWPIWFVLSFFSLAFAGVLGLVYEQPSPSGYLYWKRRLKKNSNLETHEIIWNNLHNINF